MKDGPVIAAIAALIGDPARANMLTALMDGRALTVSELARAAGVTLPTASGHLAKLETAGLVRGEKQGRHRYLRLSDPDVGAAIEALMNVAQRAGAVRIRTGPRDSAMRVARVCYDHLAGERGVEMLDAIRRRGFVEGDETLSLSDEGRGFFAGLGIDAAALETRRRPLCRSCLDWSERRAHLGGALGAAVLTTLLDRGWVQRREGRALAFTAEGLRDFRRVFPSS